MICLLTERRQFDEFLPDFLQDPEFSDPHLHTQDQLACNLYGALQKPNDLVLGVYEDGRMTGLFVFLVLREERYLEMIVGLSRSAAAYREVLELLRACWQGFQADFVFNPRNPLIRDCLIARGADFDPEQHKMVLAEPRTVSDTEGITLLSERYFPEYAAMHSTNVYWTAEKVVRATDRFRVLLAIEDGHVAGYLDVTTKYEENEFYDLFVRKESRRRGWARKLISMAIALNRPKGLMLLVDADNPPAIRLYASMGFAEDPGGATQTATWMI